MTLKSPWKIRKGFKERATTNEKEVKLKAKRIIHTDVLSTTKRHDWETRHDQEKGKRMKTNMCKMTREINQNERMSDKSATKRFTTHLSVSCLWGESGRAFSHLCPGAFFWFWSFHLSCSVSFPHCFPKASLVLGFWQETCFLSSSLEGLHDSQTLKFVLVMQPALVNVRLRTFLHYSRLFHACRNSSARD